MVRETRYLYVGNLPDSISEERILDLFNSYGKIQGVKIINSGADGCNKPCAIVAFMDIKSASKAHESEIILDERNIVTHYNESSMTITVQVGKKEIATKQHSPGDFDSVLIQSAKGKVSMMDCPIIHPHNVQKFATLCVHPNKFDDNLNKPLGMLFRGFPTRSTDSSIRDGLYHDYKKYGKVLSINVVGQGDERHAIVSFKKVEDASKALEASHDKKFFGAILQVFPHEGLDVKAEFRQQDEQDEYHPKASRTLFVGNLDRSTTKELLRDTLSKYGYIIDIDIKNQSQGTCYAFIQFDNIRSVVQALKDLEDEHVNNSKVKVGFGKSMPTTCIWMEGISDTVSEKYLALQHLSCYGCIVALYIDRKTTRALVYYDNVDQAFVAVKDLKGRIVNDKRIQVDFASRDCQSLFLDAMEQSGQLRPGDRPEDRMNRGSHPFDGCEFVRQWTFDPNQPRSRFFTYEGPSLSRGGYSGRPGYFPPGRPTASRLPFYEGFEQRREACLGIRTSFKPSFEPLYDKESHVPSRGAKERSLSLERQRNLYRGATEGSSTRLDDASIRYSEEWDLIDDRDSLKKSERKRSRHHHKEKSPSLVTSSIDSKGTASKKKGQSPAYPTSCSSHLFKKQSKNSKPSRSNSDVFSVNSWTHCKSERSAEQWIDLNLYSDSEKVKCKNSSPLKHKKLKYSSSNSKHCMNARKGGKYSDESSRSSSISSESLVSLDSESTDSTSRCSDEVDVLVKKKQELIKMLEAMEDDVIDQDKDEDDDNDDRGNEMTVIAEETAVIDERCLERPTSICSEDSNDTPCRQKFGSRNELLVSGVEENESLFMKKKSLVPITVDCITSPMISSNMKVDDDGSSKHRTSKRQSEKLLQKVENKECNHAKEENVLKMQHTETGENISVQESNENCRVYSHCESSESTTKEFDEDSLNILKADEKSHTNKTFCILEENSIPITEVISEKSYEPRSCNATKKVREIMSLPLPRFAYDMSIMRRKPSSDSSKQHESVMHIVSQPSTPVNQIHDALPNTQTPDDCISTVESSSRDVVSSQTAASPQPVPVIEEQSDNDLGVNQQIQVVNEGNENLMEYEPKVETGKSLEVDEVVKEGRDSATCKTDNVDIHKVIPEVAVNPSDHDNNAVAVTKKLGNSERKVDRSDDFMTSVLDDLRMETSENTFEDDGSLEERIRALDEKLSKIQQGTSKLPPSCGLLQSEGNPQNTGTAVGLDYREKYKRHRKEHSSSNASVVSEQQRAEPSDLAKILLSRSSIFDQDTQRLEMLNKITHSESASSFSAFNFSFIAASSLHSHLPSSQQTATQNVTSGLKSWGSTVPVTQNSNIPIRSTVLSSLGYSSSHPSISKISETSHKFISDSFCKSQSYTCASGDPRRIAKPLELASVATSKSNFSSISSNEGLCDSSDVYTCIGIKSKEMLSPPISILRKQGSLSEEIIQPGIVGESTSDNVLQVLSQKRKPEIVLNEKEPFAKQFGKVPMVEAKAEAFSGKLSSLKSQTTASGNSLARCGILKSSATKTVVLSNQGLAIKNKSTNLLNHGKSVTLEKKEEKKSKPEENSAVSKKEAVKSERADKSTKNHSSVDVKTKDSVDVDEKSTSKERPKDHKQTLVKRVSEESKEDSDKKCKSFGRTNSAPGDSKDAFKKDIKKDCQKPYLNANKTGKIPLKSKSTQDMQAKKPEEIAKDTKVFSEKSHAMLKPTEKVIHRTKLPSKGVGDESKEVIKSSFKSSMAPKDERKVSKLKTGATLTCKTGSIESVKKCIKTPIFSPGSTKDKKPEEKREVKALLQELGSNEDIGSQYVSMYDMVKRRSNKDSNVSKNNEDRFKSLSQLKASSKRKQSRKNSLRLSSNDSDSNADCSNITKQKSRQKLISSSSSDISSSSSCSGDEEKDSLRKVKKKGGLNKPLSNKRKILQNSSSSEDSDSENILPKSKKFCPERMKISEPIKSTLNKSPSFSDSHSNKQFEGLDSPSTVDESLYSNHDGELVTNHDRCLSESKRRGVTMPVQGKNPSKSKRDGNELHFVPNDKSKCKFNKDKKSPECKSTTLNKLVAAKNDKSMASEKGNSEAISIMNSLTDSKGDKKESSSDILNVSVECNETNINTVSCSDESNFSDRKKVNDFGKLEIRDSDDVFLDHMDDDSNVASLPGFEGVSFEASIKVAVERNFSLLTNSDLQQNVNDNSIKGKILESDYVMDEVSNTTGNNEGIGAMDVDSLAHCQGSEAVFDDVDTDNNTEELGMAIKSLLGEETKYDQVSSFAIDSLASSITNFVSTTNASSPFGNTNNLERADDISDKLDIIKVSSPTFNIESEQPKMHDYTENLEKSDVMDNPNPNPNQPPKEKEIICDLDSPEIAVQEPCKEIDTKPKEFAGHFISTFKPEFLEHVAKDESSNSITLEADLIKNLGETKDELFSDSALSVNPRKRMMDDRKADAYCKKMKLETEKGGAVCLQYARDVLNIVPEEHLPVISESNESVCQIVSSLTEQQPQSLPLSSASLNNLVHVSEASLDLNVAPTTSFESFSNVVSPTSASVPSTGSSQNATFCIEPTELISTSSSWQSNMDRVIDEVAKGNFERGYEADYYSSQRKPKFKSKEEVVVSSVSNLSQSSQCVDSLLFNAFANTTSQTNQCQQSPSCTQFYPSHSVGLNSQHMMQVSSISIPQSSDAMSRAQNITIMTGSGLVQVSGANIPSIQHLQMYSAGVAAARQLATTQLQQSLVMTPEMLSQHRLARPSVDAVPTNYRSSSTQQNSISVAPGVGMSQQHCQIQMQQLPCNIYQNSNIHQQKLPHSPEKILTSTSQQRLHPSSGVCSTSMQQNLPLLGQPILPANPSFQQPYQLRPAISSSVQIQLPCSSSSGLTCNSFMQQQQPDLFNRGSFVFRSQLKMDQSSFAVVDNLVRQISPKVLDISQHGNVRPAANLPQATGAQSNKTSVPIVSPEIPEGVQNIPRPVLTKSDCRQQQLFIRPIMAMQQQSASVSSCMDPSSIVVGQHRMPFTIKEPRFSSNFPRAEPKTPGGTAMQQSPLMLGVVGTVGQQLQNQPTQPCDSTSQSGINIFSGLTSPPVGILGPAVLIPQQQQQLALENSLLMNASVSQQQQQQQQQQRLVQPAAVFQYATPTQHVNLHHLSNTSQLEFFVAGNRMVTPIIQALPTDPILNHGQQTQSSQGIHLPNQMQSSIVQQTRPISENLDRRLSNLSQKLPVVWRGLLALKNDSAHVQMHYVCGSKNLVQASLPDNVAPLKIAQRMRLEPTQLEQVTKRMNESEFSMLLAVPCGRDPVEIMTQSHNLQTFFIHYLQQKQAAGIVNIYQPNSTQTAYVVHIFPPCDFSVNNLSRLPPNVVHNLVEGGYLLIIITTC